MAGLVSLWLGGIPRSAYFPPTYLLTRLSLMPQLERLGIGFHSPPPNSNVVSQLLFIPIITQVTLPNLQLISFRGVSAYLECLLARISTPVLSMLDVHFFHQLTFPVPHFLQFMQMSDNLIFSAIGLTFNDDFVILSVEPLRRRWQHPLYLRISCRHFDWQVASAVQILSTLSPVLSVVEDLTLSHMMHSRSSDWHNQVDRSQWRELLRPFSSVKTIRVEKAFIPVLLRSLCSESGEMPLELLPNLTEFRYNRGITSSASVDSALLRFVNERKAAARPVYLVPWL
jgi:hypothetical protein